MDGENRYCRGCKRTLDEIARWGGMTEAQRAEVMAQLSAREVKPPKAAASS